MRLPESIVKDAENRAGEEFVGIEKNLRRIARNRRALDEKLQKVLAAGGHVYGTFLDGKDIYSRELETGENSPAVIVIGNESNGISKEMEALVSDKLFIPPFPKGAKTSESLNAAVATAITVAEFRRRLWAKK